MDDEDIYFDNRQHVINYKDAFRLFRGLESSTVKKKILHSQIYSYVFINGIWNISNVELLYRNIHLSATFLIAMLENLIGSPPECPADRRCEECGRPLTRHYQQDWRAYLLSKLNELEATWGDKFADHINEVRKNWRNKFAHTGTHRDIIDELTRLYDGYYYYNHQFDEKDKQVERELEEDKQKLRIVNKIVRRLLIKSFVQLYDRREDQVQ